MTIQQEKTAAGRIVDRALAKGYLVSVFDGGETTVRRSNDRGTIMEALQSTDDDTLIMHKPDGKKVGVIWLVWGNSPDEIVCDCSDNPEIDALVGF